MPTKPEGPAQEQCPHCGLFGIHATSCQYVQFAATPAPSQPAGAREWLKAHSVAANYADAIATTVSQIAEWMDSYARQQTAAKDAELAELKRQLKSLEKTMRLEDETTAVERKGWTDRAEAAERERDSLRAENANMRWAGDSLQDDFMTFVQHTPAYEAERDAAPFFTRCTNPDCEEGSVENGRCQSCDGTGWNRIPFEQVANDLYLASRRGFDAFKVELLAALKAGKDGQQ